MTWAAAERAFAAPLADWDTDPGRKNKAIPPPSAHQRVQEIKDVGSRPWTRFR